jgi:hypothetical protein
MIYTNYRHIDCKELPVRIILKNSSEFEHILRSKSIALTFQISYFFTSKWSNSITFRTKLVVTIAHSS